MFKKHNSILLKIRPFLYFRKDVNIETLLTNLISNIR